MKPCFFIIAVCAAIVVAGHSQAQRGPWFMLKKGNTPDSKNSKPPARPASCEVRVLWQIPGGVGSGTLGPIGKFQTDGREGVSNHSFTDQGTGLVINAAIDYAFDYSTPQPRPYAINLAILVSSKASNDIWYSIDSSQAGTRYSKGWNLAVTKNVPFDNRVYMYTLHCWDSPVNPI